ncbi:hypothetical protein TPHA_0E00700 [Tetrapisispora phaffii CBS 4417]|uniref:MSP domain-containing protein n=1 Tax=Tetrapisispora phaffii (strain ATCC 24235 / CBS 4417 / NBRC 1672 / NRRL Y-8282 / UCD 70-5) TaxID=1071381 RepID=G8BTD7_TETPH|nr:hypothetical protein TPHA_0E00700 [Tetrapisispora phaffii CBS 4417]CCE63165.1 hypothetical protein TPHA_0E00700 [Tetrapisispora phaffii CBS 4417]
MSAVTIQPDVLEFKSPFTVQSTEYASITNNSNETIAFKVKTTAPKFYCVRPNAAVVAPGETVQVQIILLGLSEEPAADFKCRDKFLVITLPAPYDLDGKPVADVWPSLEAEFKQQAVSKKMKVKYVISSEQPTQQQEQEQQQQVQEDEVNQEQIVSEPKEIVAEKKEPVQTKPIEKEIIREAKAEESPMVKVETSEKKATAFSESEDLLNTNTLIIIALIALLLGWFYY